jgi:hypothetical protein
MSTNTKDFENRLWEAADHMRANSAFEATVRGLNTEFQKLTEEAHDLKKLI